MGSSMFTPAALRRPSIDFVRVIVILSLISNTDRFVDMSGIFPIAFVPCCKSFVMASIAGFNFANASMVSVGSKGLFDEGLSLSSSSSPVGSKASDGVKHTARLSAPIRFTSLCSMIS